MIKTVGLFQLPPDLDSEAFWQAHTLAHAKDLAALGVDLLMGYSVSRVRLPLVGEPMFWGMVELWFEDEMARAEFDRRTLSSSMGDDALHFEDYVRNFSAVEVEEHIVIAVQRP